MSHEKLSIFSLNRWLVNFNPKKTESMIISRKIEPQFHPPLYFNNIPIKNVTTHKHLGLNFSNNGSWTTHINEIITKASSRLNIIRKLKFKVDSFSPPPSKKTQQHKI